MVSVKGTHGIVDVEIKGVNELMIQLHKLGLEVGNQTELELVKSGNFMQQEVQESIIGNRAEPRSVDTGKFANSINVDITKLKQGEVDIKSNDDEGKVNALEYGTTTRMPRRHFRNSLTRNEDTIKENFIKSTGKAVSVIFK